MDMKTRQTLVDAFNEQIAESIKQFIAPGVVLFGKWYRVLGAYCTDDKEFPFSIEMENPDIFGKEERITVLCNVLGLVTQQSDMKRIVRREHTR